MVTQEAATAEIAEWLKQAPGLAMNPDGSYGLQCVDAADQYALDILSVPWQKSLGGVSGARQLMATANPEYFHKIWNDTTKRDLVPRPGDIIIWGGSAINQWGHVAIVISATRNGVTVVQQDGFAPPLQFVDGAWYSNKPAHIATLGYDNPGTGMVSGWLRPRADKVKDTGALKRHPQKPAPAPKPEPVTPNNFMHGIDISSWQNTLTISAIAADFVIIKATGGGRYVNPELGRQVAQARAAGRLIGFYHYGQEKGDAHDPAVEADHFLRTVTPHLKAEDNVILDWESDTVTSNNASGRPGNEWARQWLERVEKRTKKTPWLYSYLSKINAFTWTTVAARFPLWLAWYGSDTRMDGYATAFGAPFTTPAGFRLAAWQYNQFGRLPGYNGDLDFNVFFGDDVAWRATAKGQLPAYTSPGNATATAPAIKPATPAPAPAKPVSGTMIIVVEAGDTLTSIAAQFGTTVEKITGLNPGLNPNLIHPGQTLSIPGNATTQVVVEAGDTLTSIATQFGTTVEALKKANPGLNPNLIHPGQVLNLSGGTIVKQAVVEAGDTLTSIAAQFGTTVEALKKKNPGLNPNLIHPGQVINL